MSKSTTLQVSALKNGAVIDHLPSDKVFKILELLNITEKNTITAGINLKSKTMGTKGIIKISDKYLNERELNKIAILAPYATLNIIKEYQVIEKKKIELKGIEENVIKCNNAHCITNHEHIATKFNFSREQPLQIQCKYCERTIKEHEISVM